MGNPVLIGSEILPELFVRQAVINLSDFCLTIYVFLTDF